MRLTWDAGKAPWGLRQRQCLFVVDWILQSPNPCDFGLHWKRGVCTCNQVKMRSYWIKAAPYAVAAVLVTRGKSWHRHREGRGPCKDRWRLELRCHKPEDTKDCGQPPDSRRRSAPGACRGSMALLTVDFRPREWISVHLDHPIRGISLQQPKKLTVVVDIELKRENSW